MKKFIAITLMLTMVAPFGGVGAALADSSTDPLCGPDAPDGYKRPGGYCDQIDSKGSLFHQDDDCDYRAVEALHSMIAVVDRMMVADNCYPITKKLTLVM